MIGNALPPLFSYYVGCALRGVSPSRLKHPWQRKTMLLAKKQPLGATPGRSRQQFTDRRRFRAVIPGFRFNSGMRVQLSNEFEGEKPRWSVDFRYGSPQDVRVALLGVRALLALAEDDAALRELALLDESGGQLTKAVVPGDPHRSLQRVWLHREAGIGPFEVVDELGRLGGAIKERVDERDGDVVWQQVERVLKASLRAGERLIGQPKLAERKADIYAGMISGVVQ